MLSTQPPAPNQPESSWWLCFFLDLNTPTQSQLRNDVITWCTIFYKTISMFNFFAACKQTLMCKNMLTNGRLNWTIALKKQYLFIFLITRAILFALYKLKNDFNTLIKNKINVTWKYSHYGFNWHYFACSMKLYIQIKWQVYLRKQPWQLTH